MSLLPSLFIFHLLCLVVYFMARRTRVLDDEDIELWPITLEKMWNVVEAWQLWLVKFRAPKVSAELLVSIHDLAKTDHCHCSPSSAHAFRAHNPAHGPWLSTTPWIIRCLQTTAPIPGLSTFLSIHQARKPHPFRLIQHQIDLDPLKASS